MSENLIISAPIVLLIAEDSEFDRMLLREAFEELEYNVNLLFFSDGEDLLDYLRRSNAYRNEPVLPAPGLILMDLNMPRMKGLDALKILRADASLCVLPVIVLSTSNHPKQIAQAYATGVNAYLTKPEHFEELLKLLKRFGDFWLHETKLPSPASQL